MTLQLPRNQDALCAAVQVNHQSRYLWRPDGKMVLSALGAAGREERGDGEREKLIEERRR